MAATGRNPCHIPYCIICPTTVKGKIEHVIRSNKFTSSSRPALTTFLPYLEIVPHLNRATISFLDIEQVAHEECVLPVPDRTVQRRSSQGRQRHVVCLAYREG